MTDKEANRQTLRMAFWCALALAILIIFLLMTKQLFKTADTNRIKAIVKDLPRVTDRTYMLVHSPIFKDTIEKSKTNLN